MTVLIGAPATKSSLKSLLLAVFTTVLASAPALAQTRNPLGEAADYKVDRNSSRTSSMILGGTMETLVTAALPDDPDGPAYEVTMDYTFRIQVVGNQSGTEIVKTPAVYFTPEFLDELRRTGIYEGPNFKLRHQGYADARTMDGGFYPNCDKVLIYDVDQGERSGLVEVARRALAPDHGPAEAGDIEDLQILTHIKYGVPVLGAVKLDVSGKYKGQRVKAGADYEAP